MKCPKCNSANPDTKEFCGDCGAKLVPAKDVAALSPEEDRVLSASLPDSIRSDPRFTEVLEKTGLDKYWINNR